MGYTKVTFEEVSDLSGTNETRKIEISQDVSDITLEDFLFKFVKPLLRGVGYGDRTIDDYVGGE